MAKLHWLIEIDTGKADTPPQVAAEAEEEVRNIVSPLGAIYNTKIMNVTQALGDQPLLDED